MRELPVLRETKKNQWVHQREVIFDNYRNVAETGIRHHAIQEIVESLGTGKSLPIVSCIVDRGA
jgi:hypothetical protein